MSERQALMSLAMLTGNSTPTPGAPTTRGIHIDALHVDLIEAKKECTERLIDDFIEALPEGQRLAALYLLAGSMISHPAILELIDSRIRRLRAACGL